MAPSALLLLLAWTPHVPRHPAAPHPLVPQRPVAPHQKRARTPCAGVTGLTGWIGRNFPSAASKVPERFEADVVAIDLNAVVHSKLRLARSSEHATFLIFKHIHATLRLVSARRYVLLALDGPAPRAKLETQRRRRIKLAAKEARDERGLSTMLITPGTSYMAELHDALLYLGCAELQTARARNVEYLLSPAAAAGEGELKIIDWLLRAKVRSAVLVGGDADLVLQGLALRSRLPHCDVHVLRRPMTGTRGSELLSIEKLHSALLSGATTCAPTPVKQAPADVAAPSHPADTEATTHLDGAPLDLLAISCLMGNDYLPKVRGASHELLWATYAELRRQRSPGTDTRLVHPSSRALSGEMLGALLRVVAASERAAAAAAALADAEGRSAADAAYAARLAAVEDVRALVADALANRRGADPPGRRQSSRVADARCYVRGMMWTVQMYFDGRCPDASWTYDHGVAPSADELAALFEALATDDDAEPLRAPSSGRPPLAAPLVACVLLGGTPDQRALLPPPLAAELSPGGLLSPIGELAAAAAADGKGFALDYDGIEAIAAPTAGTPLLRRATALASSPAWLSVQRSRTSGVEASDDGLPLPRLPPRPPTPKMRALRDRKAFARWEPSFAGERQRAWQVGGSGAS